MLRFWAWEASSECSFLLLRVILPPDSCLCLFSRILPQLATSRSLPGSRDATAVTTQPSTPGLDGLRSSPQAGSMTSTPDYTEFCAIDALLPGQALPKLPRSPQQHRLASQPAIGGQRASIMRRPQPQLAAKPYGRASAAMPATAQTYRTAHQQQQEECFRAAMARLQQQQEKVQQAAQAKAAAAAVTAASAHMLHTPKQQQQHKRGEQPAEAAAVKSLIPLAGQAAVEPAPVPAKQVSKHQLKKAGRQGRKKGRPHNSTPTKAQDRNRVARLSAR